MAKRQHNRRERAAAAARGANDIIFIFVNEFRTQKSEPEVKSFIFSSFFRALSARPTEGEKRVKKKAKLRLGREKKRRTTTRELQC